MAIITHSIVSGSGESAIVETTLSASDTLTFIPGQILTLRNASAGALTPLLIGTVPIDPQVVGSGEWDNSAGYTMASIGVGDVVSIKLSTISNYLAGSGVVTVTGGTGIVVTLVTYTG